MESGSVKVSLEWRCDLWTWATLVILLLLGFCQLSTECPSVCDCKWKSGKESVLCPKGSLRAIPSGLDPGTQVLDMSRNLIEKLPSGIFLSLNLLNLQKIFLSECQLVSLEGDTFAKLSNLIELDLSGNRLEFIPSHTFSSIPELRELKVSSNPISRLSNDAFVALPRLVRLELTACRLGTIETWAFRGLPDLEWLRLDKNRLLTVQAESFYPLRNLHGLEVAGNPWNCSCALQPLRDWMGKNNVPFGIPPTCSTPERIEGKSWDRLQMDDFACLPKVTSLTEQERISRVVEGENGTLLCRLRATPDTQVRWLSGNKGGSVVTNASVGTSSSGFVLSESFVWGSSSDYPGEEGRSGDRSLGIKISKLTVIRTTPREAGLYICRAESKAGSVSANFTLLVLQTRAEGLTGRLLFTGALVVAILTLVVCLLLLCVILGSRRVRTASRLLTEAEKIELNRLDHDGHMRQNGGGTVPLMGATGNGGNGGVANHVHHSNNTGNIGGGDRDRDRGGGLSLNNVIMSRKSGGGGGGGGREHNDYKALPMADPDDSDYVDNSNSAVARVYAEQDEQAPFLSNHVNPHRDRSSSNSSPSVQSPNHQMRRGGGMGVTSPKDQHYQYQQSSSAVNHPKAPSSAHGYHPRDVFPDLLSEKMQMPIPSSSNTDFTTSLPRPNRNHDPRPSYFHRRINSESQSALLSNSSGTSMERVGSSGGGESETSFVVGSAGDSSHSIPTTGCGGQSLLNRPPVPQRRSMPTSPIHERDVLSYDYHAAQLASFLEEYRLLQLELMRMSASLGHVDQPPTNNANNPTPIASSSSTNSTPSRVHHVPQAMDNKRPYIPPRQLPPIPNYHQGQEANPFGLTRAALLHHRHLQQQLQQRLSSGQHLTHHHKQQLKSILKNPTANNNNYMA